MNMNMNYVHPFQLVKAYAVEMSRYIYSYLHILLKKLTRLLGEDAFMWPQNIECGLEKKL